MTGMFFCHCCCVTAINLSLCFLQASTPLRATSAVRWKAGSRSEISLLSFYYNNMLAIDVSIFFSDLKQGVNQLQQLIADSGVTTGANLPFFNPGQQRSVVNLSADYPLFSDTRDSSRTYQTMGSDYARPPWVRPPLTDAGPTSPISVQPSLHSLKLPFQPNWLYERPTLWDDFLPPKKAELRVSLVFWLTSLRDAYQGYDHLSVWLSPVISVLYVSLLKISAAPDTFDNAMTCSLLMM